VAAAVGKGMPANRVFRRGSPVLEYWLAHAEGFEVSARAAHVGVVEGVRIERAGGHARELVIRSGLLHRRRRVKAKAFVAVDPAARRLELVASEPAPSTLADRVRRLAAVVQDAAKRCYRELAHGYARVARRAAEMWRQHHAVERK
jgi:hypothetical protein